MNRLWLLPACVLAILCGSASAHPLSQGAMDITVHGDRVAVRAKVTLEEVLITDMLVPAGEDTPPEDAVRKSFDKTYARHSVYLSKHVHVLADGAELPGRVVRVVSSTTQPADLAASPPDKTHVEYELEYPVTKRPEKVELASDVLLGVEFTPGVTWETSYAIRIGVADGPVTEGLLLTTQQPVSFTCNWAEVGNAEVRIDHASLLRDYFKHGVMHILTGYDHLLFIGALVLAAVSLWDLVKVVTAFTLAHTITLTLASLRMVSLPEWIVEPMIAASIVFVAAQNIFWPRQTRGWPRLVIAFAFGLFHGLGYAGGLIEAMAEMSGTTIMLAILTFTVGVEIGHQIVVIPFFALLKLARKSRPDLEEREQISKLALRYGSLVICLGGMWYLVAAVRAALEVHA
jgi:hydrogenase/urease accessory protein HupE